MKLNNNSKIFLISGIVLSLIIVVIISITLVKGKNKSQEEKKDTVFEAPQEIVPTVDSSVKVDIVGKTESIINISGIPDGTSFIEYQLSYGTNSGSIEGAIGRIKVKSGTSTVKEKVTFGTCSSGVCRYHEIKGDVTGSFKFSGNYGERILEKEFTL